MNRVVALLMGWLALGLETGLKQTLSAHAGSYVGAPSFVIPLAIFVAICAPNAQALWCALALGVAMDLTSFPHLTNGQSVTIVGPYAIGLVLACQLVLVVRGVVIRRNPLTLMVLSMMGAGVCHIVVCAMLVVRRILESAFSFDATHELIERLLSAFLTGGTGLVMGLVLVPMSAYFGLPGGRGAARR
jgi:hypothetical protein